MDICSDGHTEICHEERLCPICAEIAVLRRSHTSVVEELETRTRDIIDERDRLATRLEEIQKDQRI